MWRALTIFGVLGFALLSQTATGDEPLNEDAIVRVYSGFCDGELKQFRGSGLVFEAQGKLFVLTSEHVVLHSNGPFCHAIETCKLGQVRARLVAADWGMGLALLAVEQAVSIAHPSLTFFHGAPVHPGDSARTWGFPYESDSLFSDAAGRVLSTTSDRGLIPLVPRLLEIIESHGEYGMSGGPVTSADGRIFLGVLSHQYLKILPGNPSEVGEFTGVQARADHLFVIPNDIVESWVSRMVGPSAPLPSFVRDPLLQLAGKQTIFTSGFRWEWKASDAGGGPIGGGHGVGAGGSASKTMEARVEVSLDFPPHEAKWSFPGRDNWRHQIQARLLRRSRVTIPFFVQHGQGGLMKKITFGTLAEFVRLLAAPGREPVTLVESSLQAEPRQARTELNELKDDGKWIQQTSLHMMQQMPNEGGANARELVSEIKLLGELLSSGDWLLIDATWLEHLEKGYREAWKTLFNLDYEESLDLLKKILKAERVLLQFRI